MRKIQPKSIFPVLEGRANVNWELSKQNNIILNSVVSYENSIIVNFSGIK